MFLKKPLLVDVFYQNSKFDEAIKEHETRVRLNLAEEDDDIEFDDDHYTVDSGAFFEVTSLLRNIDDRNRCYLSVGDLRFSVKGSYEETLKKIIDASE